MRLDTEKQKMLESIRIKHAKKKIEKLGYTIHCESNTTIMFEFNGETIKFYPYSGWHTGKSIKDGRGLNNLLKQIK